MFWKVIFWEKTHSKRISELKKQNKTNKEKKKKKHSGKSCYLSGNRTL